MVEVFLEGKWVLFDSDHGFFCELDDGCLASLWEVVQDLSIIDRQPDWIYNSFGNSRKWHTQFQRTFLSPHSVKSVSNYSVNDSLGYDWHWILSEHGRDAEKRQRVQQEREALKQELLEEYGFSG